MGGDEGRPGARRRPPPRPGLPLGRARLGADRRLRPALQDAGEPAGAEHGHHRHRSAELSGAPARARPAVAVAPHALRARPRRAAHAGAGHAAEPRPGRAWSPSASSSTPRGPRTASWPRRCGGRATSSRRWWRRARATSIRPGRRAALRRVRAPGAGDPRGGGRGRAGQRHGGAGQRGAGLPLLLRAGGERLPAHGPHVSPRSTRGGPPCSTASRGAASSTPPARSIPVSDGTPWPINFLGPPSAARAQGPGSHHPLRRRVEGRFDRALVRDRIVLIGPTIRGVDEHPTPTSTQTRMWGVEILANAVETVVHQRYLVPRPGGRRWGDRRGAPRSRAVAALRPVARRARGARAARRLSHGGRRALRRPGSCSNLIYPPAALLAAFGGRPRLPRGVRRREDRRLAQEAMERYSHPAVEPLGARRSAAALARAASCAR